MFTELNTVATPLPFGFMSKDKSTIRLAELAPDAEGLPWYRLTGKTALLNSLKLGVSLHRTSSGACSDTAEFISPLASHITHLISHPPADSVVAAISSEGWCGTRSWELTTTAAFYSGQLSVQET